MLGAPDPASESPFNYIMCYIMCVKVENISVSSIRLRNHSSIRIQFLQKSLRLCSDCRQNRFFFLPFRPVEMICKLSDWVCVSRHHKHICGLQ